MPIYDQIVRMVQNLHLKSPRILEVGCGLGILAQKLFSNGFNNYYGIDISETAISRAQSNNPKQMEKFHVHSCYELNQLDFISDITIAVEVLEHIEDLLLMEELNGIYFIGTVPNFWASNNVHLRIYKNRFQIKSRYKQFIKIKEIHRHFISRRKLNFYYIWSFCGKLRKEIDRK